MNEFENHTMPEKNEVHEGIQILDENTLAEHECNGCILYHDECICHRQDGLCIPYEGTINV